MPAERIRPLDVWICHGCGQTIRYDERLRAPDQERNCESRCDWELVERDGNPV